MSTNDSTQTPAQAVRAVWILWSAFLAGLGIFAVVVYFVRDPNALPQDIAQLFFLLAWAGVFVGFPIGYFVRMQVYKANWQINSVTPRGYLTGNLFFFAAAEPAGLMALVAILLGAPWWPTSAPLILALLLLLPNLPSERLMQPALPDEIRK